MRQIYIDRCLALAKGYGECYCLAAGWQGFTECGEGEVTVGAAHNAEADTIRITTL
jgi:hypothetical protein